MKVHELRFNTLNVKTIFLVGGLGSNLYLAKYLKENLQPLIDVKQPETGSVISNR